MVEGSILKTTNAGTSWNIQINQDYKGYRFVYFSDENNGWAMSSTEVFIQILAGIPGLFRFPTTQQILFHHLIFLI